MQLGGVWEEIAAVGCDRVADPSPISTIGGPVVTCAGASSPTRSIARQHLRGDHNGGRQSRPVSQSSPISTIGGEVVSTSSPTRSTSRRSLGRDRGVGRQFRNGSQPSPISTIGGVVVSARARASGDSSGEKTERE
ncbi:hypothetical protein TIFTF001_043679 [Ficus carica]|uniref:Uncharacterized protein n=1 Tax=Ficus carica TaxID=3494 RepID=A0AA87Z0U7_FICCA|nr:hypothetical protein TIFTF001_043679 [Ficus carica]